MSDKKKPKNHSCSEHLPVNVNRIVTAGQMGWTPEKFKFKCPFENKHITK